MNFDDYSFQMPGKIVEYFPLTQLATVQISNDETYSTSSDDDLQVTRSVIEDVPVYTSGGGFWHLTFPIKPGDNCLLQFSQFGYDHWLYNNADSGGVRLDGQPNTWTRRKFHLSDGFCQVGWNNLPTAIEGYHATDAEFRNVDRDQRISLLEDGQVHIKTGSTTINLTKDGDIDIDTPTHVNLTVGGNVVANITGNVTETVGGNVVSTITGTCTITSTGKMTLESATEIAMIAPVVNILSPAINMSVPGTPTIVTTWGASTVVGDIVAYYGNVIALSTTPGSGGEIWSSYKLTAAGYDIVNHTHTQPVTEANATVQGNTGKMV